MASQNGKETIILTKPILFKSHHNSLFWTKPNRGRFANIKISRRITKTNYHVHNDVTAGRRRNHVQMYILSTSPRRLGDMGPMSSRHENAGRVWLPSLLKQDPRAFKMKWHVVCLLVARTNAPKYCICKECNYRYA